MVKYILDILCLFLMGTAQEIGARYLIITHDNFYEAIQPLAEWKYKKGMKTKVVKLSEIGSSSTEIKNYIANAYNNWQIPPEFLLLVGAPNYLPFPQINYDYTDNYYTDVNADLFNEILSGRMTVHSTTEAQTVVNKILLYERTPNLEDSLWFINACLIANEDYGIYPPVYNDTVYWNDVRHAKNLMLLHGYNTIDTLSNALGNNANHVIQSVNNGRTFVLYRGQGVGNWWSPFNVNPDLTNNGAKLPIVLSITCRTIGTSSTPATAEKWLLTGTPTTPRGGAGYFATTTVGGGSITFLRSAVCRGFFNALFEQGVRTFGEACEGGRRNVYALYGSASEYRGFTTLGDPEMNIWTGKPCSLIVNHPQAISVGNGSFSINVLQANNLAPVNGALVCVMAKLDTMIYAVDTTDANGNTYFNIYPQIVEDTIYVTVTGKNLKPYEGRMFTFATGRYVSYLKSFIDDSLGGNNDGIINPGEEINLALWVKNYGDSTAFDVIGTLSTNDVYTTMTDSMKSFGNILGGDSSFTGDDGYDFAVAPDTPDGHIIDFDLICRDINDSIWTSYFHKVIHAAVLVFQNAAISGGNGNGSFEPGETVTVVVTLKNEGRAGIDSVIAYIHSLSPYVGIIDSVGTFNYIAPGSTASSGSDPFIVYCDSGTPQGTSAEFQLILSEGYYCDTLWFPLCIGRKAYYIWNPDVTPTPGQNMHAILTSLGYHGDYGTDLTSDLNLYQSVWVCAGVWPNNYVISNVSPEANALVDYLQNHGGRMYLEGGDVWYYDPRVSSGYDFGPIFGTNPIADGLGDMGPVQGQAGTFTNGMNFSYGGESSFMDHISTANANASLIFRDVNDNYDCGVAYDPGNYRTVGTSFELGLLVDGTPPSIRAAVLDSIMHFFGISTGITEADNYFYQRNRLFEIYPNPCRGKINIKYHVGEAINIMLSIYDVSGRLVRAFTHLPNPRSSNYPVLIWQSDDLGRELSEGIYFLRFDADDFRKTKKIIFLK